MKKIILLMIFTLSLLANQIDQIKMFTEHYPPYNYKDKNGKLKGMSIEVLNEMLLEMKSTQSIDDVKLRSWAKSYTIAQKVKNAMVFVTTRTKARENLFKWVGPIAKTSIGIIALKENKTQIKELKDLNKYKIGAVLKDVGEMYLLDAGVDKSNIQYVKGEDAINISFNKMRKKRIDMFIYETNVAFMNAKNEGFDINKYEVIYSFDEDYLYFAFNKNTDDKIITKWQNALDTIKKNGIYDKINFK